MEYIERLEQSLDLNITRFYGLGNRMNPSLGVGLTIRASLDTRISAIAVNGSISILAPQGPEIYLGELKRWETSYPPYPVCLSPNSYTQSDFLVELSWETLEKIEKLRAGGEVIVKGALTFLFVETPATPNEGKSVKRMFWMNGTLLREQRSSVPIHRDEWLNALKVWGYASKRVLEIDLPSLERFGKVHEIAYAHLQNAMRKEWEGDYRHVLTECRICLESLKGLFDAHLAELEADDGNIIRKQKIDKLQKAIKEFCDIGPHQGQVSSRAEALLCLSITRELLVYLGEQRCANKKD